MPAASMNDSAVAAIHASGGPITCLATAEMLSSCPGCCQFSMILCPSE